MAAITITHTHEDGTLLTGSRKGDGVYELVRKAGFTWRRNRGICINPSRDHDAKTWIINGAAAVLREAGHEVTIDVDNAPRPTAVVEAERAEHAEDRADRYDERAGKADAAGDAREAASRAITDGIPFGQPRLVGHHSYNRHTNALNRADNHDRKAAEARGKGKYLAARADGAIANQQHWVDPRVTMRRIETLETEKRGFQRTIDGYERNFRNGRGEIVDVEKHAPASGEYRTKLQQRIDHIDEQIAYWRTQLDGQAESGAFVPWSKDHFAKGDAVRHHGFKDWYEVTRINAKSVSVAGAGWPRTITWDDVGGRRRDGMQWDAPNGQPWPVELARKVARWPNLQWIINQRTASDDDALRKQIRIRHAQRIVLGLDLQASAAEVAACLKGIDDVDTDRRVKAAFVDVYDRLAAGEKTPDVQAGYTPIELVAAWRMPDREPDRRIAAKSLFIRDRDDIIAVHRGDLIVGYYDYGSDRLFRSFCGPVATVSEVNDRRERGEFVTITLVDGQDFTAQTHMWFAVHPAGTWEQKTEPPLVEPEADDSPVTTAEQCDTAVSVDGFMVAETRRVDLTAEPEPAVFEADPWGPVLDKIESGSV